MNAEPDDSTALPNTMQAMVQDAYGEAEDVLRLEEIAVPEVAEDRVLLRVHAAGIDRGVWHLTAGLPYPVRLAGFGVRAPKNRVRGTDVAGTVVVVGSTVTGLAPGDEVYGVAEGSFAEYATARPDKLAPKPANLTYPQAAAVAISGLTALQALRDHAKVQPGQKVLILGASGGVGSYDVQIAKAFGAEVTGVCSTTKVDLVRALGADHVIDYTVTDLADDPQRYDVILDIGGNRPLSVLRRSLTPRGTLVVAGGETGGRWIGGYDRLLRASALSPFVSQKLGTFVSSENREDLLVLTELIESGQVTPSVDRTYPLREAAAAMRHMLDGHARGKVVITVSEGPSS
jgi:NADPH:quinone reductase-like Zn-dependent oxidoreductase